MRLELITLLGVKMDEEIYELIAPTAAGPIAVFPGHEALVTLAIPGALAVRRNKGDIDEKLEYFAISGGVIEVAQSGVRVLVDEADHGEEITEAESKAALDRALKLRDEAKDQVSLENAQRIIGRMEGRLRVAELTRRRRRH